MNSKQPVVPEPGLRVVRVLADVTGFEKQFDYTVPREWEADERGRSIRIGTRVRVQLQGRRVAGWVTAVDVEPIAGVKLRSLTKLSGHGPDAATIELAHWVGDRWLGHPAKVLRSASPPRNVDRVRKPSVFSAPADPSWVDPAFDTPGGVVRIPPGGDRWPVIAAAIAKGNPLIIAPNLATVDRLVKRLRRQRVRVARLPDAWALAAGGAVVVGTRPSAVGPVHDPGSIVVLDEHDESLQEERQPTWHAREVALERARRLNVPCVLVSPTPTLEALAALPLLTQSRAVEFEGWPAVDVIDRREEPPGTRGLFSEQLVRELRTDRRVACIVNRKGRARLLACATCGEITSCTDCQGAVRQIDSASTLDCGRCGLSRPVICQNCGATKLKNIRMGVTRAREELEALIGDPVAELTASGWEGNPDARVVVGTEAALHDGRRYDSVAFLDFDQEMRALRQRAAEQAFALLGRAARTVGSRGSGGRLLVQTRAPDDPVLIAALRADPGVASDAELVRRTAMQWPPVVAQASVSGAGASKFMASLGRPLGLTIAGPNDGRWLVRAATHQVLTAALREVPRPPERLRIEVDPLRI